MEDLSSVYNDVEVERGVVKHTHKKRKLTDGREKTMVRPGLKLFKFHCLCFLNCCERSMMTCYCLKWFLVYDFFFLALYCRAQMMKRGWEKVEVDKL